MVKKVKELLLFQASAMQLGMDLSFVMSIQSLPGTLSKQLEKHNFFAPLTENQDILLVNLSGILGNEDSSAYAGNEKLIVVNAPDKPAGLIVERVDRVIKTDMDRIEPLPSIFQGPALSCFPMVLKHEGRLVLLMSPQAMVNIVRQIQKHQVLREGVDSKNKDESRSEVESADTFISEMIMKSRQNVMEWEGSRSPI